MAPVDERGKVLARAHGKHQVDELSQVSTAAEERGIVLTRLQVYDEMQRITLYDCVIFAGSRKSGRLHS